MEFKEKYLKYKEKYISLKRDIMTQGDNIKQMGYLLKKQTFKNQIGGVDSYYDLTDKKLYCFSDEEGGNPFILDNSFDTDEKGIFKELNADFDFSNGIITEFKKENVAFAFLGDLLDNSKYSIRLLERYIRLKNRIPKRVILIGGNRDFNKIRMGIELFCHDPTKEGLDKLPWHNTFNLKELILRIQNPAYNFVFRDNTVPEYLKNVKLWDGAIATLEANYNKSFHDRLDTMFKKTKGINAFGDCGYTFIVDELNEMFGLPDGSKLKKNDEISAKIICIVQMIMSFNWEGSELPQYLSQFNGLYINYLKNCHVISVFNIGEKFGILSHSGYPKKLTYPFGYDADNAEMNFQKSSLVNVIANIEKEKILLIEQVQAKKNNMYAYDTDYMINKFVHLTAGTTFENTKGAKASNSPVVWGQTTQTNQRTDIKLQIKGGNGYNSWIEKDVANENKFYVDDETEDIISYNIFGHAPQFFNPTLYRKTAGNTLHVNLDISKIEAHGGNSNSSNNYSFAFFVIDSSSDKLIGRIKFPDATKVFPFPKDAIVNKIKEINSVPKPSGNPEADAAANEALAKLNAEKSEIITYINKSCAYMDDGALAYNNKVHYYNIDINNDVFDLSLNSNIPELSLKVSSFPPMDFTRYVYSS
jgi:hypothetical protein